MTGGDLPVRALVRSPSLFGAGAAREMLTRRSWALRRVVRSFMLKVVDD